MILNANLSSHYDTTVVNYDCRALLDRLLVKIMVDESKRFYCIGPWAPWWATPTGCGRKPKSNPLTSSSWSTIPSGIRAETWSATAVERLAQLCRMSSMMFICLHLGKPRDSLMAPICDHFAQVHGQFLEFFLTAMAKAKKHSLWIYSTGFGVSFTDIKVI